MFSAQDSFPLYPGSFKYRFHLLHNCSLNLNLIHKTWNQIPDRTSIMQGHEILVTDTYVMADKYIYVGKPNSVQVVLYTQAQNFGLDR